MHKTEKLQQQILVEFSDFASLHFSRRSCIIFTDVVLYISEKYGRGLEFGNFSKISSNPTLPHRYVRLNCHHNVTCHEIDIFRVVICVMLNMKETYIYTYFKISRS